MIETAKLDPLWTDTVQQEIYRELLQAMAYPGDIRNLIDIADHDDITLVALAALVDQAVSLADPHELLDADTWRFLGARRAPVDQAQYLIADGRRAPTAAFQPALGSYESPEKGATIAVRVTGLGRGRGYRLRGPGIAEHCDIHIDGLHPHWLICRQQWCRFPIGVDLLLCDDRCLLALPRTTGITELEGG